MNIEMVTTLVIAFIWIAIVMKLLSLLRRIPSKEMIAEKEAQLNVDKKDLSEYTTKQLLGEIEKRIKC
jgi:hypothetical protein